MAQTTPPRIPQKKKGMKASAVIAVCTCIALAGVAGSGAAGYFGSRAALSSAGSTIVSSDTGASGTVLQYDSNGSATSIQVLDVSDVVSRLRPSVVEITTEVATMAGGFFRQYSQGAGSGVILSEDGYIVTNHHVIEGAETITVKTIDGQEYNAALIGSDSQTDIAVLKIDAQGLTPASVGNSNDIKVGEAAIAIGNPLGSLGGTVTTGIISAVGREITIEDVTMTLLQTDAAINPGNSGGGLFDVNGQLIGIVNAKTSDTGIEGLGFAIPISDVTSIIDDLVEHGEVTTRPVLNVSLDNITSSYYYGQNRSMEPGIYIVQIVPGGTADISGLQLGDRIVSFDGQTIESVSDIKNILKKHSVGDQVDMTVVRDGQEMTLTLTLKGPSTDSQQG